MRINGFEQIKALYSMVFNQECNFTPQHISLYVFLVNQNNRNNWVEWFKCPFDLGMAGSCIGNKKTYYKCLNELQGWGLLTYEKGENAWKAPKIRLEVLNRTSSETATVPQAEPLLQQLGTPLPTHNIKPVTSNHKQETEPVALHPLQLWVKENCPRVSRLIQKQLTNDESEKLLKDFHKDQIKKTLSSMENYKKLNYVSVNLTLRKWMEKDIQTNGTEQPINSGPQRLAGTNITFTPKING